MIVSRIDQSNKAAFQALIPDEIIAKLGQPAYFALGVIAENDNASLIPAGALVFSVEEGITNDEDDLIAATIQWLYVAPPFRDGRAADTLMHAFWDAVDQGEIEHILCDVPMPPEYDQLCAYLESWNFQFVPADRYELTVTLQEIISIPALQVRPQTHTLPLEQVLQIDFQHFLHQVIDQPGVLQDLPPALTDYDRKVSCVQILDTEINSALLVQQVGSQLLEITLLRTLSSSQQRLLDLCRYAAQTAAKRYSPETRVRIVCRLEAVGQLLDRLFPNAQPLLVRRGYYYNGPEDVRADANENEQTSPLDAGTDAEPT